MDTSDHVYTFYEMQEDIVQLATQYPDRLQYCVWGKSVDNRDIYGLVMGNPEAPCAIHAIPMINPDGVCISQMGLMGIADEKLRANIMNMQGSKNPMQWKANANGVDLNRKPLP